jgi:hypothetical protein
LMSQFVLAEAASVAPFSEIRSAIVICHQAGL